MSRSWSKRIKISGKKLLGKDEEASCLKNLNQNLLEQIKKMKDEKPENQNIINKSRQIRS